MILDGAREPGARRLLEQFGPVAVLVLGSFAIGVLAVRSTTEGIMLIVGLVCLVVYLTRPEWMIWLGMFLAFASLPAGLHVAKTVGPLQNYAYQVAVILAICFLLPVARLRFSAFALPLAMLAAIGFFTVVGLQAGHDTARVAREASFLVDMVAGFVLALLIVRIGYVKGVLRTMGVVLWVSAAMVVTSSVSGLALAGRTEEVTDSTGTELAVRLLTASQTPALAVLATLLAGHILGKAKLSVSLALGVPAVIISLLAFSRNTLIVLGVTAAVAFSAGLGFSLVKRTTILVAIVVATVGVVLPAALFLTQNSAAGLWFDGQVNAFSERVLGGISSTALATDSSTLARLQEIANLDRAFSQSPLFGHGLGYAYQLPFGKPDSFTATLGTTYAHNFYMWWLVKGGLAGMAVFVAFALIPVIRALRAATVPAKIAAAVSAGLLAVCTVDPLPLDPGNALALGLSLGAAMGFAMFATPAQPSAEQSKSTAPVVAAAR